MKGHYLSYPPTPIDLWKAFGTLACVGAAWDLTWVKAGEVIGRKPTAASVATFDGDARSRVGNGLYELFFKPLANKIWGDPKILDQALSKSRIQVPQVSDMVNKLLHPKQRSTWQADTYLYPKGGLSSLWNVMADTIREKGGILLLKDPIQKIESDAEGNITSVQTESGEIMRLDPSTDWVVSTVPLSRLARTFSTPVPEKTTAHQELRLNDLWLIFLKIDGVDTLKGNSWMFIPDPSIIFHRVSTQRRFDPGMVEASKDVVCCEVMSYPGKDTAGLSENDVIQRCIQGLLDMKLIESPKAVKETRFVRLPQSYPVMTVGYQDAQKDVLNYFDRFKNLRTVGRQGAYNYIGTLDAMDTGFGIARYLAQEKKDSSTWEQERQRTLFYPILD